MCWFFSRSQSPDWLPPWSKPHAQQWIQGLFAEGVWARDNTRHFNSGEAGGFLVRKVGFPFPAYLKPTKLCPDDRPRAATEKIASDLAAELGLPVPPVLLYRRGECPEGEEPRACLSLVMYPEQWEWGKIDGLPDDVTRQIWSELPRFSGIIAFDTYVGNTDRVNNNNAIFATNPQDSSADIFVFLDYSNSMNMGNRWENNGWQDEHDPPAYPRMKTSCDVDLLSSTLAQIEALEDETIDRLVSRIPDDYMIPSHKATVIEGLLGRRSILRKMLEREFPI